MCSYYLWGCNTAYYSYHHPRKTTSPGTEQTSVRWRQSRTPYASPARVISDSVHENHRLVPLTWRCRTPTNSVANTKTLIPPAPGRGRRGLSAGQRNGEWLFVGNLISRESLLCSGRNSWHCYLAFAEGGPSLKMQRFSNFWGIEMGIGWICSRDLFETSWEGLHEALPIVIAEERIFHVCLHCLSGVVIVTLNRSYRIRTDAGCERSSAVLV